MQRFLGTTGIALAMIIYTIIITIILTFIIVPLCNNTKAYLLAHQFKKVTLPIEIQLLETKGAIERNNGSGEYVHCVGVGLIKTQLSIDEIRKVFELHNYGDVYCYKGIPEIYIYNTEQREQEKSIYYTPPEFKTLKKGNNDKDYYYYVEIRSKSFNNLFDLRAW